MAALKQRLQDDIKDAMRARNQSLLGVLRFISAAIKQREVDERIELSDDQIISVLDKMTKQRREAIEQFSAAGRNDLAEKETFELHTIEAYLPKALTASELEQLIAAAIAEQGATSIKDMAKVMAVLRPQVIGRADMAQVSQAIKDRLTPA
jgi:uncharacterized protein YqeY